jgi:histidine triad (HIT) family protein
MYNHAPKNYDCPLCHIAKREPTEKGPSEQCIVFQNTEVTAFIAGRWWRSNPGHVVIMPNQHFENLYDMPEKLGHAIFDASKKVAVALKETYACDGVSTRQHNEPAGNQDAFHFHLHVFPRYAGDNLYLNQEDTYWATAEEQKYYADKLEGYFSKNK